MKRRAVLLFLGVLWVTRISPSQTARPPAPAELTIEAIFAEGGLTGRAPEAMKWSPDGTKLAYVQRDDSGERGELYYVDPATGQKAVLVSAQNLSRLAPPASRIRDEREREWVTRYSVAAYHWAPDSKQLLFDSRGQFWLYRLDTGTAVQVTASPERSTDPKFSPDGRHISYLRKHDIWMRPVGEGEEVQITKGGNEELLNGEVDWVYAEELDVRRNYFWSPDSQQIAFLQMNEQPVPTYPIVNWMPTHPSLDNQRYPKAGDSNPEVRVGVVDAGGGKVRWIQVGDPKEKDFYVPRFGWVRAGLLYIYVLNRLQNKLDLYFVDATNGRSRLMLTETSDTWVNVEEFQVLESGDRFLWLSWRDGYTHIYLYSFNKGHPLSAEAKLERQLTSGQFDVASVSGLDEASGTVYFLANADDPRQHEVYSVKLAGAPLERVTQARGWHSANFNNPAQYYADTYSALLTPPRVSLCKVGGSCTPLWESKSLAEYGLIQPRRLELKAADGLTTLYGHLLLPPGADHAPPGTKYPLILSPYGGPGGQVVRDAWGGLTFLFHQVMARQGFAILQVDNRGMGTRGKKFAAALRYHFGRVELEDQLEALDQVLRQFPMLDKNRVGWWGWSYGGYMTLYAMTHSDRIRAGVAGAPVTSWRNYDTIYTERYMGLPKDNAAGYKDSSPVEYAEKLQGRVLIVHGTSDDNVHMQNTIQIIQKLILAGKQFDLQLLPNKTHGVTGSQERSYLYRHIQEHFQHWLGRER